MDVGDGGQAEFGVASGWRPDATNRMFFSFVLCVVLFPLFGGHEEKEIREPRYDSL